jgi:hypothetical protein
MIVPGVLSQDGATAAPLPPYTASAVHFGGSTILWQSTFSSTNSQHFAFSGWFNVNWLALGPTMFVFDPVGSFSPWFAARDFQVPNTAGTLAYGFHYAATSPPLNSSGWQHVIGAIDSLTPHAKMYFDGVSGGGAPTGTSGYVAATNGKSCFIGGDSGSNVTGDVADLSIWIGIDFFDALGNIPTSTQQLFRSAGGLPVKPSVAIAALGTPEIMLSGNATTFPNNALGSAGTFTYNPSFNTPLTNATTHP